MTGSMDTNGSHKSHRPTLMPTEAAATIHTDQLVNGDAGVQVKRDVGDEEATAFRAAIRMSMDVLFHPLTVYPLEASSTGKISRGTFTAGRYPSESEVLK